MKKKIGIILVIILIISTTYMHKVLALGMTGGLGGADIEQGMTTEKFQEMMEQGTATVNGGTQKQKQLTSSTNQNDFSTLLKENQILKQKLTNITASNQKSEISNYINYRNNCQNDNNDKIIKNRNNISSKLKNESKENFLKGKKLLITLHVSPIYTTSLMEAV